MKLEPAVSIKDHSRGNRNALITLVEYGDFECPHCAHAHVLIKELLQRKSKVVRLVFRHFPLGEIHGHALTAAQAAEAAGRQGKFWPMHDLLFENQGILSEDRIVQWAVQLKLHPEEFKRLWKSGSTADKVRQDFESGVLSGVNGTPGFFINGSPLLTYDGTYSSLEEAVNSTLQASSIT